MPPIDVTPLLQSLHAYSRSERDEVVEYFRALDRDAVLSALKTVLASSDLDARGDAAEAILRIDRRAGLDLVIPLLRDPDAITRWHVSGLMHDFGDERATDELVHLLLEDGDADVRLTAAYALEEIGDARAMAALQHAVAFDDGHGKHGHSVRRAAEDAIQNILSRGAEDI
jgi:HEAT repeat protein